MSIPDSRSAASKMTNCGSRAAEQLPLLPTAPMPRGAAAGAGRRAELLAGLAGVGGLDDPAGTAEGFLRFGAVGTEGQGFGAVHFVEMGFVDFGGTAAGTTRGLPLSP